MTKTKVAWVREPGYPVGKPAPGRLACACGGAPLSFFNASQRVVFCACGTIYTWDGYLWEKKQ